MEAEFGAIGQAELNVTQPYKQLPSCPTKTTLLCINVVYF